MSYGELIRDAFRITLRNRYLWFFGFFVGGLYGTNIITNIPSGGGGFNPNDFSQPGLSSFGAQASGGGTALLFGLILLGFLLFVVFLVLALISQGGLAESVHAVDRGEPRRFSSTFRAGTSRFWWVLGYYVVYFLISLLLFIVVALPFGLLIGGVFLITESAGARISVSVLAGLLGLLLFFVLSIALSIVFQFGLRELVIRREGIFGSFGGGFRLLRNNLGKSLLVWLINVGLSIATWIATALVLLVVGLVVFLPTIILATQDLDVAARVTGVVAGIIMLPIVLVVSGALGTFFHSYWTLAYLRISLPDDHEPTQAEVAA